MNKHQMIERSIITKFRPTIWRQFVKAIDEYRLIKQHDKIAVCISGGKDSMLLAKLLQELQAHGNVSFEIVFLAMNPGYNEENTKLLENNAQLLNIPLTVFETNIFASVENIKDNPCYLCARMRRGHLYAQARELGCNKIALGHHFDDVIETIVMGMLYGAQIQTMMPKLHSKNYPGMELIRPMYLVKEENIIAWSQYNNLHFLKCACKLTRINDRLEANSKRQEIKSLIKDLRKKYADIDINIFRSVENINLNTIIGYHDDQHQYHFLDDYENNEK